MTLQSQSIAQAICNSHHSPVHELTTPPCHQYWILDRLALAGVCSCQLVSARQSWGLRWSWWSRLRSIEWQAIAMVTIRKRAIRLLRSKHCFPSKDQHSYHFYHRCRSRCMWWHYKLDYCLGLSRILLSTRVVFHLGHSHLLGNILEETESLFPWHMLCSPIQY